MRERETENAARRVGGDLFEAMLRNGLVNLRGAEEQINLLNVFPVADGDTGTNLRLTLEHGLRQAKRSAELGPYLRGVSEGMLLGARGNSGVILSQIFRGIAASLSRCAAATPGELRNALVGGYKAAYRAVVSPVEGTMLTVAREGIEHIRRQIDRATTVEALFSMYVAEMRKSLAYTPEMLAVLKESGVVDSGALGYITIIEGMLKYLRGQIVRAAPERRSQTRAPKPADLSLFSESSPFTEGYCLEFLLQLMTDGRYLQNFRLPAFLEDLKLYGKSIAATQDGRRVKVHIHTLKPAKIVAMGQEYGEFLTFKLENMQVQHNEYALRRKAAAKPPVKPLGIVAAVNGEGLRALYTGLGCSRVLDGGTTMNPAAREFLEAFETLDAETVVVLPNNRNAIAAAEQAVKLSGRANVRVLPTASVAEGYFALSMDIPDSTDAERRVRRMAAGRENVVTLAVTAASRAYEADGVRCAEGEAISLIGDRLAASDPDPVRALVAGLRRIEGIENKESCVLFRGEGVPAEAEAAVADALADAFPALEPTFLDGGQRLYPWIIGII